MDLNKKICPEGAMESFYGVFDRCCGIGRFDHNAIAEYDFIMVDILLHLQWFEFC